MLVFAPCLFYFTDVSIRRAASMWMKVGEISTGAG